MRELAQHALAMAREASAVLLAALRSGVRVDYKGTVDLVTDADRRSEAVIKAAVARHFPDHGMVAEESAASGAGALYRWVIDPLDGTVNFAHGIPHFCVLIAVQKRNDAGIYETVVGVTVDPMRQEEFVAVRGDGATLNDQPIRVSSTRELIRCAVATGFGYNRLYAQPDNHAEFCRMNLLTQGVRRLGAAGLDLAYVACGRMDMYWEYDLKPWDMTAGVLLVSEAGGQLTGLDGEALAPEAGTLLASNGHVHGASLAALRTVHAHPINDRASLLPFLPPDVARRLSDG